MSTSVAVAPGKFLSDCSNHPIRSSLPMPKPKIKTRPYLLLVEDSADEIELFFKTYDEIQAALEVRVCADACEALGYLEAAAAEGPAALPLFVLLDIKTGNARLNGFEFLRALHATPGLAQLPAIMFSVAAIGDDVAQALQQGASAFVLKPMNRADYAHTLAFILVRWGGPRAALAPTAREPNEDPQRGFAITAYT